MAVKEPNTRKVITNRYPDLEQGGKRLARNWAGGLITYEDILEVLGSPLWKRFEKANLKYKLSLLRRRMVPKEFVTVIDFVKPKKTKKKKRGLPVSNYVRFPVVSMFSRTVNEINNQRIIVNDCVDELDRMTENSVDVSVTSPPYNIGIDYNSYEDAKPDEEYLKWIEDVANKVYRVLKPEGSFFLNVGGTNKDPSIPERVCSAVLNTNFVLQNHIVWVKSISVLAESEQDQFKKLAKKLGLNLKDLMKKGELDLSKLSDQSDWKTFGHFKPINSKRFVNNCHEAVFHFTKKGETKLDRLSVGVPYEHKSNIERWKHDDKGGKPDKRCRGNVWHIPYKTVMSAKEHPAGYPVQLAETCIKLHGVKEDMVVLDPFLGAGSTLVACRKLGVRGIGIELDKAYGQVALEKIT